MGEQNGPVLVAVGLLAILAILVATGVVGVGTTGAANVAVNNVIQGNQENKIVADAALQAKELQRMMKEMQSAGLLKEGDQILKTHSLILDPVSSKVVGREMVEFSIVHEDGRINTAATQRMEKEFREAVVFSNAGIKPLLDSARMEEEFMTPTERMETLREAVLPSDVERLIEEKVQTGTHDVFRMMKITSEMVPAGKEVFFSMQTDRMGDPLSKRISTALVLVQGDDCPLNSLVSYCRTLRDELEGRELALVASVNREITPWVTLSEVIKKEWGPAKEIFQSPEWQLPGRIVEREITPIQQP